MTSDAFVSTIFVCANPTAYPEDSYLRYALILWELLRLWAQPREILLLGR